MKASLVRILYFKWYVHMYMKYIMDDSEISTRVYGTIKVSSNTDLPKMYYTNQPFHIHLHNH